jgi:hypothetical protein
MRSCHRMPERGDFTAAGPGGLSVRSRPEQNASGAGEHHDWHHCRVDVDRGAKSDQL